MKNLILAVVLAMLGIGLAKADFLYESEMTVSGYSGTETLSGFPVLVRLAVNAPQGFNYGLCQADGKDIAFYSADGETVYPHEIETWDSGGESLVWVRIPSLSGTNTKFLFRFGDSAVTSAASAKETWANSNGGFYAGVWHFADEITAEDATATTAPASPDSAQHSATVDMSANPASTAWNRDFRRMTSTNAVIGLGRVIDDQWIAWGGGHHFECGDSSSFSMGNAFTASSWTKPIVKPCKDYCVSLFGNGGSSETGNWRFGWNGFNAEYGKIYLGSTELWGMSLGLYSDMWRHYVLVVDGTSAKVYVDGVQTATTTSLGDTLGFAEGLSFNLGGAAGVMTYSGILDEARLLKTAASADWVKAEYETVKVVDFVVAGAVKSRAANMLTIASDTEELGMVTPAYGVRTNIKGGDVVDFSAPDGVTVVSDQLKYRFDGWTLYRKDANDEYIEVDSAETNSFHYVHTENTNVKFVWKVRRIVPITVSATGGAVTINGLSESTVWCEEGVATLVATPDETHAFGYWSGSVAGVAEVTANEVEVTGASARTLTAVFRQGRLAYRGEAPLTVSGCTLGEAVLTNFPVLVRISPDRIRNFSYNDAGSDGNGIAFFSLDGKTAYAHEVDHWDVKGESTVWVKVPRLSGTTTKMLFDYGSKQDDATPAKHVWNDGAKIRYAGVWHFGDVITPEDATTTTAPASPDSALRDAAVDMSAKPASTASNRDLTRMTSTNAVVGLGRVIDNQWIAWGGGHHFECGDCSSFNLGHSFTASSWTKPIVKPCKDYCVSLFGNGALGEAGNWRFGWNGFDPCHGTLYAASTLLWEMSMDVYADKWRHVVLVVDGTSAKVYMDGVQTATTTSMSQSLSFAEGLVFNLGGASSVMTYSGILDEARLLAGAASVEWVTTEYNTVANADFVTFGKAKLRRGLSIIVR